MMRAMTNRTSQTTDVELDAPNLDDWRTFLQAHALLSRRLDDELRIEQGMSLAEFDALVQLAIASNHRLRMNQLADRVLLSRSGVTRLVDRLVADGLVTRSMCTTDARGAEAVITIAGIQRLRAATTTHLRGVSRYFVEPLSAEELAAIGRSLGTVVERLRSDRRADGPAEACDPAESARA
jgi:DNA-binding MarR family transcriptional regulator